jgi:hypothetical protein
LRNLALRSEHETFYDHFSITDGLCYTGDG